MNTLSITSTSTMTYDAEASAQSFAIIEKLVGFTGALIRAARQITAARPALRAARP